MKLLFSFIFSSLITIAYTQIIPNNFIDLKPINLDSIIPNNTITNDSINTVDIKSEYWNNTVYNPYKGVNLKFPLKISFNDSLYASPLSKKKVITSRYGWRWGRAHKGIDIDLITGDSVVAMLDGIVRFARYNSGHGKTVIIRHFNGLETVYAHLSKYNVKANDTVKRGSFIGKGGRTGNARGSHLHLVVNYMGKSINPEYLFDFSEENKIRAKELWVTKDWTRPYLHNSKRQSKLNLLTSEEQALASLEREKKVYIVKRGDTLSRISARNNTSISRICTTNNISRNSVLKIGQKLVIQ